MNTFDLKVMASDHAFYSGPAYSISVPTTEGSIGVLAHHANTIMAVVPGLIEIKGADENGRELEPKQCVVSDGMLKIENNEVIILVDTAESPEEIDIKRAERAEAAAREELLHKHSKREYTAINAELSRALSRLKATRGRR